MVEYTTEHPEFLKQTDSETVEITIPGGTAITRVLTSRTRWYEDLAFSAEVQFEVFGAPMAIFRIRDAYCAVLAQDGRCGIAKFNSKLIGTFLEDCEWTTTFLRAPAEAKFSKEGANQLRLTAIDHVLTLSLNGHQIGTCREGPFANQGWVDLLVHPGEFHGRLRVSKLAVGEPEFPAPFTGEPVWIEVTTLDRIMTESGAPSAEGRWRFWLRAPRDWAEAEKLPQRLKKAVQPLYAKRNEDGSVYILLEARGRVVEEPGEQRFALGESGGVIAVEPA